MRKITITLTEQDLLETTGRTLEEVTDVNGYQTVVPNLDAVSEFLRDEDGKILFDEAGNPTPNPEYDPAVHTLTISNPEKRTEFLARRLATEGMRVLSEPLRRQAIRQAERQANELFSGSIDALVGRAQIVTEGE